MTELLKKTAISNGLVIAAITIAIQLITYYAAPQLLGATWYGILITFISLIIYVVFTFDMRKKIGGYWTFKEALSGIFIMSVIANLSSSVFNFVFYRFIEPGAYDKVKTYVEDGITSTFEKMGMSGDQLDEAIEKSLESLKAQYLPTFGDFFKNLVIAILVGFVFSLIFAAIFKKNPPMFAPVEGEE
ncbi:hypothetical protein BCY91_02480 [Pelobium manganitolerans]|uniref:DUF4199 domain-containing protein n=1 Tax=Pelobium manganitolerans TaxID=1842495 RepID=A0A419S799_9SPHI|nr:DUF4199 domain-containing protein [Pelobium manganitolerans]RKD17036.1 hypothetical protein BCY91_02480 [Pelobium manganitolerans]